MNQAIYLTEHLHEVIHLQYGEKNTSESQILQYIAIYWKILQYTTIYNNILTPISIYNNSGTSLTNMQQYEAGSGNNIVVPISVDQYERHVERRLTR